MKMYKYKKNIRSSEENFIYSWIIFQRISIFTYENIKPSWRYLYAIFAYILMLYP